VRGVAVLAFAVIMVLIGDPWLARNYGCVLSVLATGGLIVLAGPLARRLSLFMPLPLAAVIAVPLAAQLACQPVLILLNPAIPVYGVVANVLAAPAAPVATVLGLLACVLLPAVPLLAGWCAWIAWAPSSWVAAVALFFSGLPGAQLPWPPGILGLLALALSSTAMLTLIFSRSRSRLRTVAIVGTLCVIILIFTTVIGVTVTKNLNRPPGWQIALCDIGQGDAVLVRSAGHVALIDTGAEPALLRDCLAETGVGALDLLVLTHFDFDHVGGASALIGKATRVIHSPPDGERDERLLRDFAQAGADVDQVARGVTGILGELRWSVLSPSVQSAAGAATTGNDASVVTLFTPVGECAGGCLSAILLGDLGERAQDRLRALQQLPAVDVVKVSHHGSADQSPELYERLSATVGIIGVGAENTYGHPTKSTLDILATSATRVVRSDLDGLALLAPGKTPGEVVIWTKKSASGGP
jgi:competence protein ComEC